ncbi:hypothetical protein Ciccas_007474 [Cichlidogyrus casuarinus]|uniref:Uncharacterized protein n=1 Tax=Cichlidogyrus casuarinus TaxID=1844966 RepID=A0ABD2Q2R9_9PLAT
MIKAIKDIPFQMGNNAFSTEIICQFIVIVTFGAGVDYERNILGPQKSTWLIDLKQADFSWSYGLACLSFLSTIMNVLLLNWFVIPRKSFSSNSPLLSPDAWNWPDGPTCLCRRRKPSFNQTNDQLQHRRLLSPDPTILSNQTMLSTPASIASPKVSL